MARRLPSSPPILPGFSYLHVLGSGGFADVFLYEQNLPRRQVAVKVMLSEMVDDQIRQMFQAEANLMAQLSAHPAILTVYEAGVSADGRPYLVMELCSASLGQRFRSETIPVAEVLRVAIKIGSAIETAHRSGVLHRDIKPSNILTTAYGHPVLSDFGIASTFQSVREQEMVGLSIPWSAPEVLLDEVSGSVAAEVWAFAATVYTLLAGRSPFELPGGDNSAAELISRIARARPLAIDRADVPGDLERLLRRALSRQPQQRPSSVLEVVRELQAIEAQLGLPQTLVEIARDDWATGTVADLEDRTLVRPVAGAVAAPRSQRRRARRALSITTDSPDRPVKASASAAVAKRPAATLVAVLAVAGLAIVLGVLAIVLLLSARQDDAGIPTVRDIGAAQTAGGIEFRWSDPGLRAADRYQIEVADGSTSIQAASSFVVEAEPGETVCITVRVHRQGSTGPASAESCAQVVEE